MVSMRISISLFIAWVLVPSLQDATEEENVELRSGENHKRFVDALPGYQTAAAVTCSVKCRIRPVDELEAPHLRLFLSPLIIIFSSNESLPFCIEILLPTRKTRQESLWCTERLIRKKHHSFNELN